MNSYDWEDEDGWEWHCLANISRKATHGSITLRITAPTFAKAAAVFADMLVDMGVDEVYMVHIDKGESSHSEMFYD